MNKDKAIWLALGAGAAIGASLAARRGATAAWRHAVGEEPPEHAADPRANWTTLVAWATLSGLCVATARLIGRGAAAATYQRLRGRTPPSS
ncbi:DUF4235 domain-containing protein [Salinisphaera hydrothermalis]|uniref:DUF4235 domain-containing protein n=1 Tax=Salinisphaera hydrothermalis TaxID=563188 RepID=UPI00333EB66F